VIGIEDALAWKRGLLLLRSGISSDRLSRTPEQSRARYLRIDGQSLALHYRDISYGHPASH